MLEDEAVFDFIVSGAGSAGCAVAARLSESGRHSVLLLEAGPRDSNPWIHIPLGFTKLFTDETLNWKFESEPVEALDNRVLYQPRGKVLGGSSSINGTIYMRGAPADYDQWRQRGLQGWDWDSVLPFFKKAEDNARGGSEWHGAGGPLRVSDVPHAWELPRAMIPCWKQSKWCSAVSPESINDLLSGPWDSANRPSLKCCAVRPRQRSPSGNSTA